MSVLLSEHFLSICSLSHLCIISCLHRVLRYEKGFPTHKKNLTSAEQLFPSRKSGKVVLGDKTVLYALLLSTFNPHTPYNRTKLLLYTHIPLPSQIFLSTDVIQQHSLTGFLKCFFKLVLLA